MKTKNLIIALSVLLCFSHLAQAQVCGCNCAGMKRPSMILRDVNLSENRSQTFWNLKRRHVNETFPQEIPMIFDEWKKVLGEVKKPGVTGIRLYFAQNEEKDLNLIFVPTKSDPITNMNIDVPNSYTIVNHHLSVTGPTKINDIDAKAQIEHYKYWFKNDVKTDMSNPKAINETESIFYSKTKVEELYDTLETGCLKGVIKYVSAYFASYNDAEQITATQLTGQQVTKDVGYQLLIHFRFRDCEGKPMNFDTCYGAKKSSDNDAADTGLPCPDFCNGEIPIPLPVKKIKNK